MENQEPRNSDTKKSETQKARNQEATEGGHQATQKHRKSEKQSRCQGNKKHKRRNPNNTNPATENQDTQYSRNLETKKPTPRNPET